MILALSIGLVSAGCSKKDDKEASTPAPGSDVDMVAGEVPQEPQPDVVDEEPSIEPVEKTGYAGSIREDYTEGHRYSLDVYGDEVLMIGMPYDIEKSVGSDWERVDLDLAFTMQIISVSSEEPFGQYVETETLEPGIYRFVKQIMDSQGEPLETQYLNFEIFQDTK